MSLMSYTLYPLWMIAADSLIFGLGNQKKDVVVNTKNEWKWMVGSLVASVLVVGWATSFEFTELEIATNEVFGSGRAIFFLAGFLYTLKNLCLLTDVLTARYKVISFLISIINPIVALLVVVLLYFSFQRLESLNDLNGIGYSGRLIPIFVFAALLVFQAVIEVRALMSIRAFIQNRNYS